MKRPHFKTRIRELERIYRAADGDRNVLRTLQEELEHRKTRRAVDLRQKVTLALEVEAEPDLRKSPRVPPTVIEVPAVMA